MLGKINKENSQYNKTNNKNTNVTNKLILHKQTRDKRLLFVYVKLI